VLSNKTTTPNKFLSQFITFKVSDVIQCNKTLQIIILKPASLSALSLTLCSQTDFNIFILIGVINVTALLKVVWIVICAIAKAITTC
jgi:hypothetical protein